MQLACDHALDTGNCVFLNEKRPQRILTLLDLTNPLIISVDQPKEKEKKSKYMYLVVFPASTCSLEYSLASISFLTLFETRVYSS